MNTKKVEQQKSKSQAIELKAFEIIQKNLTYAGIYSDATNQSNSFNWTVFIGFLSLGSGILFTSAFIIFDAKTIVEYTQSIYAVSVLTLILLCFLIIVVNAKNLFKFIDSSGYLVNTTLNYSASKSVFIETIRFEQKWSEIIFFFMVKMTPACFAIPFIIYSFAIYLITDLRADAFELPSPLWLPVDWKNPAGYLIVITLESVVITHMMLIGACAITFGIATYLYAIASSKCIKGSLFSISRCASNKIFGLGQFIEFIEFHSRVKQWLTEYSDVIQPILSVLFIWSLISISGALLMIQLQILHHSDNLAMLAITALEIIYAFVALLVACEVCQRINLIFDECNEMVKQLEWYLFPAEIKRMLPLMLNFALEPIEIKCFGTMTSDREAFKYIIKTAYSYFTVLRSFYG